MDQGLGKDRLWDEVFDAAAVGPVFDLVPVIFTRQYDRKSRLGVAEVGSQIKGVAALIGKVGKDEGIVRMSFKGGIGKFTDRIGSVADDVIIDLSIFQIGFHGLGGFTIFHDQ